MKKFLTLVLALWITVTVYASNSNFTLSRIQQNRLNVIVKQLKIPFGEYKFTISSTGTKLENLISTEPQIVTKEVEVIKEVRIEVPVEKEVIRYITVEKQVADPRVTTGSYILSEKDIWNLKSCNQLWNESHYNSCVVSYIKDLIPISR